MKRGLFSFILALSLGAGIAQSTHVITNQGFSYVPDSLVVQVGDTVMFNVGPTHPTVQTSQATWSNNGTSPLATGFNFQSGVGSFVITQAIVHYYVCQNHAAQGMKGRIYATNVSDREDLLQAVEVYPNPVMNLLRINLPSGSDWQRLQVSDFSGKQLIQKNLSEGLNQHVDVSHLGSGIYLLMLESSNGLSQLRFTKN